MAADASFKNLREDTDFSWGHQNKQAYIISPI